MAIDIINVENKATGGQLTAEEFNRIPTKINELVAAHNSEEERVKKIVAKNRPSLGQLANVNVDADNLLSDTHVLVWGGDEWIPVKLSELGIGNGGSVQQSMLYYLRAVNQSPSTTLSASKSSGECKVRFMFVSRTKDIGQTDYTDTGEWGTYEIFSKAGDGTYVSKLRGRCQSNAVTTIDVFKYLESGLNNIMIKVTGEVTGQTSPALVYSITLSALFLDVSEFNWWKAYQGDITLPCYISGNISKTLHVRVDGDSYSQEYSRQFGTATYTTSPVPFVIPFPGTTGIYKLSAWLSNEDDTITTDRMEYNFMAVENNANVKMVVVNNVSQKLLNWYENNVLEYAVYDGQAVTTQLAIGAVKEATTIQLNASDNTLTQTRMSYNLSLDVETIDNADFIIGIQFLSTPLDDLLLADTVDIQVDNSHGYAAVAGAQLYINARNRSNTDADRETLRNLIDNTKLDVTWKNMKWSRDGWMSDSDGVRTLRIAAGARMIIGYRPFAREVAQTGITIEMSYQTNNVADYGEECISIAMPYPAAGQGEFIGLKITPDKIFFATRALHDRNVQSLDTDDGVRIHLTLVVSPKKYTYIYSGNTYYLNLVTIYINGVEARKFAYLLTDSMLMHDHGDITIGADTADVDIYSIRVYGSAMDAVNVHQNYINSLATVTDKSAEKQDNDIYDTLGSVVDFEKMLGKVNIFTFDKPFPSYEYGKTYKPKGTLEIYPKAGSTTLNRLTVTPISIEGQGTSSMLYFFWNVKFKSGDTTTITYEDGAQELKKFVFFKDCPKVTKLTAKKNIASSMQYHKMGTVNAFTDLFKALGMTNEGIEADPKARISVRQESFLGFEKMTADDGTVSYKFNGLFTMGPDKGDSGTFGYNTKAFPNLLSIEGSDNSPRITLYQVPWDKRRIRYNADEEAFQYQVNELAWENCIDLDAADIPEDDPLTVNNETVDKAEQLIETYIPAYNIVYQCNTFIAPFDGTLEELNANPKSTNLEYWIAKEGDPDRFNLYYYDSLYRKFCPSTLDSGITTVNLRAQLVGDSYGLSEDIFNATTDMNRLNELFKAARLAKLRSEQSQYWDIQDALYHAGMVELIAATDNAAKNTYPYNFNV